MTSEDAEYREESTRLEAAVRADAGVKPIGSPVRVGLWRQVAMLVALICVLGVHHLCRMSDCAAPFMFIEAGDVSSLSTEMVCADWTGDMKQILEEILGTIDEDNEAPPPDSDDPESDDNEGSPVPDPSSAYWFHNTRSYVVALHDDYALNTDPEWSGEQWASDVYGFADQVLEAIFNEEISDPDVDEQSDADVMLDVLGDMLVILDSDF